MRSQLSGGAAYAFASQMHALQEMFDPVVLGEVNLVYVKSAWVSVSLVSLQ